MAITRRPRPNPDKTPKRAPSSAPVTKLAAKRGAATKSGRTAAKDAVPAARATPGHEQGLAIGARAPAFALQDASGTTVRLSDFAGRKVVVYFYPKDDTPGCTREACGFQESIGRVAGAGAVVLGVSRDGASSHARFSSKFGLSFPLLSDTDGSVHRAYGAWGTKTLYGKTRETALRTTVIVDARGRVLRVFRNVKVDGHVERVLAELEAT